MKVLVGQYHMNSIGGTETFTYTLIHELYRQGFDVDLLTLNKGILSDRIDNELGISTNNLKYSKYDLALVNHIPVVDTINSRNLSDKIIQTSHGFIPPLEHPSFNATDYVSISEEIEDKFNIPSTVILNGIDCNRFTIKNPIGGSIKKILSLVQSVEGNNILNDVCSILGCELITLNKNINPSFDIVDTINECDLVVGLGRSAYGAMACGRPVFIWDYRHYQGNLGDGYLTHDNFSEVVKNNCSGRRYKKVYDADTIANEIKMFYDSNSMQYYRDLALTEFNINKQVDKYLEL